MGSEAAEREVARIVTQLPPLPENVDRLLEAAARRPPDAAAVLEAIAGDPGLCVEVLHLAAACGPGGGAVDTMEAALARVGPEALAQLVGVHYTREAVERQFSALAHLDEYFDHSREISRTCAVLAESAGLPSADGHVYATAGLIHDVGRLVIMTAADWHTAPLVGTSPAAMGSIVESEKRALGMNHCRVGMQLCRKWRFAPVLQEGVLRHHTPCAAPAFSRPGALIFLAHFVSASDFTGDILARIVPEAVFSGLGLSLAAFEEARTRYQAGIGEGERGGRGGAHT